MADPDGREHAVVSDGYRRIRFDVEQGHLGDDPVTFHYLLQGCHAAQPKLLALRRLVHFCINRSFARGLFPADPRLRRAILALRVGDAARNGAGQREIAELLFGAARIRAEWTGRSDSLRSRVRRLLREAQRMTDGGYRGLLRPRTRRDRG